MGKLMVGLVRVLPFCAGLLKNRTVKPLIAFAIGVNLSVGIHSPPVFAAIPIAQPGTEGFEVIVSSTGPVIATYQGNNSATFSNDLYLVVDGNRANDRFLFNNHASQVGSTVNLGSFPAGTTLVFRLHVRNTGRNYFTGPASRNPDNKPHARAQANWKPNETLVSFEDNIDFAYNDLSFSFVPTTAVPSQLPPEIVQVDTFREGQLVFFRVFYTDPNNDAAGFGFRGAHGSLWAEETHPFSSPSFGHVLPGMIEYPFNHACGTPSQYESDVAVWIYDRAGLISQVVTVHLACSAPTKQPKPGPQWVTPPNGATVPHPNDLVFEVAPVTGAVSYLYSFKENGQLVWENWSHEQRLDGARYILARGSAGHLALGFGANGQVSWPVQVEARGYILEGGQYHWTEASIINITLVGFSCIYGPGGSCIDGGVNPIPPSQWPSPDEIRLQLVHIGMGALCVGQFLAAYTQFGPVGVVVLLPTITNSEPCTDLTQETSEQVEALIACIPRYSWEVCLLP